MGMPYGAFIFLFGLGVVTYCASAIADGRSRSRLRVQAMEDLSPYRAFWDAAEMLAMVAWVSILVIGFISLQWYVALGLLVGVAFVAALTLPFILPARDMVAMFFLYRAFLLVGIADAVVLWAQRLTH